MGSRKNNSTPHIRRRLLLALGIVAICLGCPRPAVADRIDKLIKILGSKPAYKVRLQVVLVLTRLRPRRAVPALVMALNDPKPTIRGLAATALGKIGDIKALAGITKRLKQEQHAFARGELKGALKLLQVLKKGPPRGTRFFITTGKMVDNTEEGAELVKMMSEVLDRELAKEAGIVTYWAGRNPKQSELRRRRIKGFILDGSIIGLSRKQVGNQTEITCKIKITLSTYPGNSMRVFVTRSASMRIPKMPPNAARAAAQYRDVLEGALVAAKQDLVRTYLSRQ